MMDENKALILDLTEPTDDDDDDEVPRGVPFAVAEPIDYGADHNLSAATATPCFHTALL